MLKRFLGGDLPQSIKIMLVLGILGLVLAFTLIKVVVVPSVDELIPEHVTMKQDNEKDVHSLELNETNFKLVLDYYEIKHPKEVYAQALLETNYFTSFNCRIRNNTLGLVNSYSIKRKDNPNRYFVFSHWSQSIKAYKDYVEYKLKDGEDYYEFLERIGYAEDPSYVLKIKALVNKLEME